MSGKDNKPPTLNKLWSAIEGLRNRLLRNEKDVKSLKDVLNTHNNWAATTREWLGKDITLCTRGNNRSYGKLLWVDRYNLALEVNAKERIYHKSAIDWLELKE